MTKNKHGSSSSFRPLHDRCFHGIVFCAVLSKTLKIFFIGGRRRRSCKCHTVYATNVYTSTCVHYIIITCCIDTQTRHATPGPRQASFLETEKKLSRVLYYYYYYVYVYGLTCDDAGVQDARRDVVRLDNVV